MIHIKTRELENPKRLIVYGHYSNPRSREQSDQDAELLITNIRMRYPDDAMVFLSDMNRDRPQVN